MNLSDHYPNKGYRLIGIIAMTFICLFLGAGIALAQKSGTVNGVIVDNAEHLPMTGVTVSVMKGGKVLTPVFHLMSMENFQSEFRQERNLDFHISVTLRLSLTLYLAKR